MQESPRAGARMFLLPTLTTDHLRFVSVCVHIDLDRETEVAGIGANAELVAKIREGDEEDLYARRILDTEDETCHYHVEIGFESAIRPGGKGQSSSRMRQILTPPRALAGSTRKTTVGGRFRILRSQLPEDSFIKILLGVSISSGGYNLDLSGGILDVSGKGPLREVRWFSPSDKELVVDVTAYASLPMDDELFIRASKIIEQGMDQVVFRRKKKKKKEIDE